jgi:predicted nucleic acid-binding protein
VRFWDASAILPLLVADAATPTLQDLAAEDGDMLVWWGSEVECASAIARLTRDDALDPRAAARAWRRLTQLADGWHEVDPADSVREAAVRFLRVHPLTAADAFQLAAAFIAAERRPPSLELVTLDNRLAAAADKEGFALTPVSSEK